MANFSVYSDYLATNFATAEEKLQFIKLIKDRSEIKFDVEVNENSKLLTLSTCLDNNRRLVVHAILLPE